MSERVDRIVIGLMTVFTLTGFVAFALMEADARRPVPIRITPPTVIANPLTGGATAVPTAVEWFKRIRPYCNSVEVDSRLRLQPGPASDETPMYEATCYALAGRVGAARSKLLEVRAEDRWRGAGLIFEAVHPAADAGDELAAGPLMELVVEFWPNNYMALYHAGAAAFQRGEREPARRYLESFLDEYEADDGWTSGARAMLAQIG